MKFSCILQRLSSGSGSNWYSKKIFHISGGWGWGGVLGEVGLNPSKKKLGSLILLVDYLCILLVHRIVPCLMLRILSSEFSLSI